MPIQGFPDPELHRFCRRCRQWFDASEGEMLAPEATGPLRALRNMRAITHGPESVLQFQCYRCGRIRRITQWVLGATLAALIVLVLALERCGLLE